VTGISRARAKTNPNWKKRRKHAAFSPRRKTFPRYYFPAKLKTGDGGVVRSNVLRAVRDRAVRRKTSAAAAAAADR